MRPSDITEMRVQDNTRTGLSNLHLDCGSGFQEPRYAFSKKSFMSVLPCFWASGSAGATMIL